VAAKTEMTLQGAVKAITALAYRASAKILYLADTGSTIPGSGAVWKCALDLAIPSPSATLSKLANIQAKNPYGLAVVLGDASLMLADRGTNNVYSYDLKTGAATLLMPFGAAPVDGAWNVARTVQPRQVYQDPSGVIYFADQSTVRASFIFGVRTVAGSVEHAGSQAGSGLNAAFHFAQRLVLSPTGTNASVIEFVGGWHNAVWLGDIARLRQVTIDAPETVSVGGTAAIRNPIGELVHVTDIAVNPVGGKRFLLGSSKEGQPNLTNALYQLSLTDGKAVPLPVADFPCAGKNELGKHLTFDSLGRGYLLVSATSATSACGAETPMPATLLVLDGLGLINYAKYGTTDWAAELAKVKKTQIALPDEATFFSSATFAVRLASQTHAEVIIEGASDFKRLEIDLNNKIVQNVTPFGKISGRFVLDLQGNLYLTRAATGNQGPGIWYMDGATGEAVRVSGSHESGTSDGPGALGRWNWIVDMAFDPVNNRLLVLDRENVLRELH